MAAVNPQSIRFTVPDKTFALRTEVPLAVGNEIFGRFTFDAAGGNISVSAVRSTGIMGGGSAFAPGATRIDARMSDGGSGLPVEYTFSFSAGVLSISPRGATAQAIFGLPRDEALLKLIVGQAIFDATTKLKATKITGVRLVR
jgi:hypothetical protein